MKIIDEMFQGKNVSMQIDNNGDLWFEIESLSMAIGYVTKAKGKEYVHKSRMNKTLKKRRNFNGCTRCTTMDYRTTDV